MLSRWPLLIDNKTDSQNVQTRNRERPCSLVRRSARDAPSLLVASQPTARSVVWALTHRLSALSASLHDGSPPCTSSSHSKPTGQYCLPNRYVGSIHRPACRQTQHGGSVVRDYLKLTTTIPRPAVKCWTDRCIVERPASCPVDPSEQFIPRKWRPSDINWAAFDCLLPHAPRVET